MNKIDRLTTYLPRRSVPAWFSSHHHHCQLPGPNPRQGYVSPIARRAAVSPLELQPTGRPNVPFLKWFWESYMNLFYRLLRSISFCYSVFSVSVLFRFFGLFFSNTCKFFNTCSTFFIHWEYFDTC